MNERTLILFTNDGLGRANKKLRRKVLTPYLTLILESGNVPGALAFYTRGVKLVAEGSPVLDLLAKFEQRRVSLIVCKTCVDTFGLSDKVRIGTVGGMGDIILAQQQAEKVITA